MNMSFQEEFLADAQWRFVAAGFRASSRAVATDAVQRARVCRYRESPYLYAGI